MAVPQVILVMAVSLYKFILNSIQSARLGIYMCEIYIDQSLQDTMQLQTDRPAAPFSLPDFQGRICCLQNFSGHWLLLVFHRHLG
jgi:hypothetical protein